MELISICAWCQPDTSATNTTHGICETHADSMINLYLLKKNVVAPAFNTRAAIKRAHHEEEETPLKIIPSNYSSTLYLVSERIDGNLIQMKITAEIYGSLQVGFKQLNNTWWIWFVDTYVPNNKFIGSQVKMSANWFSSMYVGYVHNTPGDRTSTCVWCEATKCVHATMMLTIIENEIAADYANKRAACEKVRY